MAIGDKRALVLVGAAFLVGLGLFFTQDVAARLASAEAEWYAAFAQTLFRPTSAYFAESVLLPLVAKLVGASGSLVAYKLLCAVLTTLLLPVLAAGCIVRTGSVAKTGLVVAVFAATFAYLTRYALGFPDPLTLLGLMLAALAMAPGAVFGWMLLAALSHFSLALFAAAALAAVRLAAPDGRREKIAALAAMALALLAGKALLFLWFKLFRYRLETRLDWVVKHGLSFFAARVEADPLAFWLTPGWPFLCACATLVACALFARRWGLALALPVALGLSYGALFLTVDGLRIFAVAVSAAYVLALAQAADLLVPRPAHRPSEG